MTLEWIDPPRNWQDEADDTIKELRANPGRWARIYQHIGIPAGHYTDYLHCNGIEWRTAPSPRNGDEVGRRFDFYARAPEEAE